MTKTNITFICLSALVCIIALCHITLVSLQFDFDFSSGGRMTHPAMVTAFISASCVNIVRILDTSASNALKRVSVLVNILTLSLASAFTLQHPIAPKIITTALMAMITLHAMYDSKILSLLLIQRTGKTAKN